MLRKTLTLCAVLFALSIFTTPATAQGCSGTSVSQTCTWTASITVQAVLTCSVTQNFSFGSHPSSVGTVGANETMRSARRSTGASTIMPSNWKTPRSVRAVSRTRLAHSTCSSVGA